MSPHFDASLAVVAAVAVVASVMLPPAAGVAGPSLTITGSTVGPGYNRVDGWSECTTSYVPTTFWQTCHRIDSSFWGWKETNSFLEQQVQDV